MDYSRKCVAYLGPQATYSHQAALATHPSKSYDLKPLDTIPAIFAAVQAGVADFGVVPFYNSSNGAVIATLDSFATSIGATIASKPSATGNAASSEARFPNVAIRQQTTLRIRHCLLGTSNPSTSSVSKNGEESPSLDHITKVYSHVQGLGQCAGFLSDHIPHAEQISVTSTSRAAQMVASKVSGRSSNDTDTSVAAISSDMAAELYGVEILRRDIQDRDDNTTRFFVLERGDDQIYGDSKLEKNSNVSATKATLSQPDESENSVGSAQNRSLILFTVSHKTPGALARVLITLEKHDINLIGIHQRPPDKSRSDDAIFVEVECNSYDERLLSALTEVKKVTENVKNLGSWSA